MVVVVLVVDAYRQQHSNFSRSPEPVRCVNGGRWLVLLLNIKAPLLPERGVN